MSQQSILKAMRRNVAKMSPHTCAIELKAAMQGAYHLERLEHDAAQRMAACTCPTCSSEHWQVRQSQYNTRYYLKLLREKLKL